MSTVEATREPPERAASLATPLNGAFPRLRENGLVVRFESREQFLEHYKAYITHGGLMVRTEPLSVGSRRTFSIEIKGLKLSHLVRTFVVFRQSGVVGFVIEDFQRQKKSLSMLADRARRE